MAENLYGYISQPLMYFKILERLVYTHILPHINEHNLQYKYQFRFRKEHSQNLSIIYLVDKISNALQNWDFVLGLYLDFSKAFDTINHDILFIITVFEVLHMIGFKAIFLAKHNMLNITSLSH